MLCGFDISFYLARKDAQLVMNNHKLGFRGDNIDNGDVKSYNGREQHIVITVSESDPARVRLKGCLPKYYKGNNNGLFTLGETKEAVKRLMTEYMVPADAKIHRLELSINLHFDCPEVVINSAMLYHGRIRERIHRKNYYGCNWYFEDKNGRVFYKVKLYKKGKSLLRYELHLEDMRKIKNTGVRVISDLVDDHKLILALFYLYNSIDEFLFIPEDIKNKLPPPLSDVWNEFRIDTKWEDLLPREMKDKKSDTIKRINNTIKIYDLIDWRYIMKQRFLVAGAQELEISEQALITTFSQLDYPRETVAGPARSCDRQADPEINKVNGPIRIWDFVVDKKDILSSSFCSSVFLRQTVANGRQSCILEVVRVFSDIHLGGRGPPETYIDK